MPNSQNAERSLYLYKTWVTSAMARPQTIEKGPHTRLERLIQYPAVMRQKIVSVMSPRNAPITNSKKIL